MTHPQLEDRCSRAGADSAAQIVAKKRLLPRPPAPIIRGEVLRARVRGRDLLRRLPGFRGLRGSVLGAALCAAALTLIPDGVQAQDIAQRYNDYPTAARADYVFACMATNGRSRLTLEQCSCSIDEIASILPYEKYLQAETVLSMRRTGGERMAVFNSAVAAQNLVTDLRRAQAEAEVVCF